MAELVLSSPLSLHIAEHEDFTPVPGRRPLTVTIVDDPSQLLASELQLSSSIVVLLGCGFATTLTTALGPRGGAKRIRIFPSPEAARQYGEKFAHPSQWTQGGETGSRDGHPPTEENVRGTWPGDYLWGLRGKALLYASESAAAAVTAGRQAKELVAGCYSNFSTVRRHVLQWWSDVSETDAAMTPDLNTRCILVCGVNFGSKTGPDRYLAAALAWQLVQAADVVYGDAQQSNTRSVIRLAVEAAAEHSASPAAAAALWNRTRQELWAAICDPAAGFKSVAEERSAAESESVVLGLDSAGSTLPIFWSHTGEFTADGRTHTRMPDAVKFDGSSSVNRWPGTEARGAIQPSPQMPRL
jgi:hypothetical protein